MTFLPIVERELRVAARRSSTYRMRFLSGLAVTTLWLVLLVASHPPGPAQLGHHLLTALSVLALGFSMFAGVFLTSDCLSEEKREGTLGLLFLTDLKGYDVVLGKLAAASIHAVFGLLAIFPVLGLPLLLGGVSGAEFWRVVLVLMATLFLSLGLGLVVSASSYEARHSISAALMLVVLFAGICPAFWWLHKILFKSGLADPLLWPSAGFALLSAYDWAYRFPSGTADFWRSLGTILGLGLGCMVLAIAILPRVWQQGQETWLGCGLRGARKRFRRHGLAEKQKRAPAAVAGNPYFWLASRDGSAQMLAGALLRVLFSIWCVFLLVSLLSGKSEEAFITCFFIAYGMHLLVKILFATEASRRVSEDRHSGALELLLVTPLPLGTILAGHRQALRKLFRTPLTILVVVNLGMMATVLLAGKRLHMDGKDRSIFCELLLGGLLLLMTDFYALRWTGMWAGLTAKRHHRAVIVSLAQVMAIPWAAVFFQIFLERGMHSEWQVALTFAAFIGLGLVVDAVAGSRAKAKLERDFRLAALQHPS